MSANSPDPTPPAPPSPRTPPAPPASASSPAVRPAVTDRALRHAARRGWDDYSAEYQAMHGEFLGDARFIWCPEGLDEADAGLLGELGTTTRVLEVGCGAGQCARWLAGQRVTAVGVDVSIAQLRHGRALDARTGLAVPTILADAERLPLADESFDVAFSAFGAIPFTPDLARLLDEVGRVLRPGGRWVFSVTHPFRWCFPDDPSPEGLRASLSYWSSSPYLEYDEAGTPVYVEHHRTVGEYVRALHAAGFVLRDLREPEWPDGFTREWSGWTPERGRLIPGTAIFCCVRGR